MHKDGKWGCFHSLSQIVNAPRTTEHQKPNRQWDMGPKANDKTYFPFSDDWRRKETREAGCTKRISALLQALHETENPVRQP